MLNVESVIVVPTFGQEDYTVRCFQSIRKFTDPEKYLLLWVDNASSSDSRDVVTSEFEKHKNRIAIWNKDNLGFVGGVNLALHGVYKRLELDFENLVIQNNDTEVTKDWLSRMTKVLREHKTAWACGPITSTNESWQGYKNAFGKMGLEDVPPEFENMNRDERAEFLFNKYGERVQPAGMIAFFCTVFKRCVFEELGFLDTRFGLGFGDDDDLCQQMAGKGHRPIVSVGTYVFHNHRTTFKSLFSMNEIKEQQDKNLQLFKDKHNLT